ncbi:MAG: DUF1731 domain-containing protein [Gemmatimonadales bacterium]|nr:MAG: DUF1731 domain-containing protein [Gemmatimonadales bacterium]
MECFVTGGTGAVGRGVVRALLDGGHTVTVLTHTPENGAGLEAAGARPVVGDMREPAGWIDQVRRAEAVVHMAQLTPVGRVSAKAAEAAARADLTATWSILDALDGTRTPFIYTSGAWVYGSSGDAEPRTEESPTNPYPLVTYKLEGERQVLRAARNRGVAAMVTRPGTVYGPGGTFARFLLEPNAEKGRAAVPGGGRQITTYLHADDCGAMYRALLEDPSPGEVFNLGDTEPIPARTMAEEVARLMDARPPSTLPGFILRLASGRLGAPLLGSHRISSAKFAQRYGYTYRYPTYREGAPAVVEAYRG